ncbi:MAG: histidinol-phosphatase HisJ family protein [Defluviitaleaceae bacterium]|nr:histidinol-phosphatase HisJ family protein [Defluviitaleaceae bacterium]MCL2836740.1 histidinol-phosphatase HisJ family protein [Defluviitaleaceae bacterium]
MYLADYHIHTDFSIDAKPGTTPEACIKRAISLGLHEMAITDHHDFKYLTLEPYPFIDMDDYVARVLRLKDEYAGRISVKLGLELGPHIEIIDSMKRFVEKYPFDFIICSTHDIKGLGIWDDDDYFKTREKHAAHAEYLEEVLSVITAFTDFSVYGHLDYLDRYGPYDDKILRYAGHADIVDAIFKKLIENGNGLEINTSGFRYNLPHTTPKPEFLRRYKELGGEILTLGSDAHSLNEIGADFDKARDMLISLGFKYISSYEKMQPTMRPL